MIFLGPGTYIIWCSKGCSFCINFGFKQFFWFSSGKLSHKMDQNCKLLVYSIWAKIQNFEEFFKHCVSLTGRLPLFKISANSNNICGSKGSNLPPPHSLFLPKKGPFHRCQINMKNRKLLMSQPQMLFLRNSSQSISE